MIVAAFLVLLLSFAHVLLCDDNFKARNVCSNDYTLCSPKGASTLDEPPISSALSPLFIDILNTVDDSKNTKRDIAHGTDRLEPRLLGGGLCCKLLIFHTGRELILIFSIGTDGTQCLLLQGLNFPFCYVSVPLAELHSSTPTCFRTIIPQITTSQVARMARLCQATTPLQMDLRPT